MTVAGVDLAGLDGVCWLEPESLQSGEILARVEISGTDPTGTAYPTSLMIGEFDQGTQHALVVGVHPQASLDTTNYGRRTFIEATGSLIERNDDVFSVDGEFDRLPEGSEGPRLPVSISVDCS